MNKLTSTSVLTLAIIFLMRNQFFRSNSSATDRFTTFQTAMMIQLTVVNILQMIKELVQMYQQVNFRNFDDRYLLFKSILDSLLSQSKQNYSVHWQRDILYRANIFFKAAKVLLSRSKNFATNVFKMCIPEKTSFI